ncbi:MAG: hypothetical protein GX051_04565 [Clostridiales bacterium]|nr:hypothetical protein [Clostridiales bacterium]
MDIKIYPSEIGGKIQAQPSKSFLNRALVCAALCDERTVMKNVSLSGDVLTMLDCIRALGAQWSLSADGTLVVLPGLKRSAHCVINCRESGTALRFLLACAPLFSDVCTVKIHQSLAKRPVAALISELERHGVKISISSDSLSYTLSGVPESGEYILPGDISSQFASALMLALPGLPGDSVISLSGQVFSSRYIKMTAGVLGMFGVSEEVYDNKIVVGGNRKFISPSVLAVPGDWSNAAPFSAMGKLFSDSVEITGIEKDGMQGDEKAEEMLDFIYNSPSPQELDISQNPDLAPVLAAFAAACGSTTRLINAHALRYKESDRLDGIVSLICELGGEAEESGGVISITGGKRLEGGTVDSRGDHRMAMAAAVASCACSGAVTIKNAQAVEKSYPSFWEDFKALGGKFDVI